MGDSLRQDLSYALRALWKAPGFAAIAVLTIGVNLVVDWVQQQTSGLKEPA